MRGKYLIYQIVRRGAELKVFECKAGNTQFCLCTEKCKGTPKNEAGGYFIKKIIRPLQR